MSIWETYKWCWGEFWSLFSKDVEWIGFLLFIATFMGIALAVILPISGIVFIFLK